VRDFPGAYVELAVELSETFLADDPQLAPSVDGAPATLDCVLAPILQALEAAAGRIGQSCCLV